ncbi:hypothetical protein ACOSQ4_026766 [Xanthoceras sorbifolium]
MQQHVSKTDEELIKVFKAFDERNFSSIKFELEAMLIVVEFPDEPLGLLQYNVAPPDPIVDDVEMPNDVELRDSDTDFQPDDVSNEDSYVNLVDDDINGDHPIEQCDLDSDPLVGSLIR